MSQSQTLKNINIFAIKAFTDNYIWAINHTENRHLALVDPGDAKVCIDYIENNQLILSSILITHHHHDHTGGIEALVDYAKTRHWPIEVYAPAQEDIAHTSVPLKHGDNVALSQLALSFSIIALPGHTLGHIAYYTKPLLFCGDTLFSGGCGRLFEGTPAQMLSSLNQLKQLPDDTRVYCTHEYTLANLEFALAVEPFNQQLIDYYNEIKLLREKNAISLPSSIRKEKLINPFLRCDKPDIRQSASEFSDEQITEELGVFTAIRRWKDNF